MHSLINTIHQNNCLLLNKNINMLTVTPDTYLFFLYNFRNIINYMP